MLPQTYLQGEKISTTERIFFQISTLLHKGELFFKIKHLKIYIIIKKFQQC
jgi:hypothetical protein